MGEMDMWWIIGILVLLIMVFLWLILNNASRSVDDETQRLLDEEQTRAIEEYLKKEKKENGR